MDLSSTDCNFTKLTGMLNLCMTLSQLLQRESSQELLKAVSSLFQAGGPPSFSKLMSGVSSLFCGYPEGGGSRVLSFNWYEDNNYKVFLGVNGTKSRNYVYDDSASKWRGVAQLMVWIQWGSQHAVVAGRLQWIHVVWEFTHISHILTARINNHSLLVVHVMQMYF